MARTFLRLNDPLNEEFAAQRTAGLANLRARSKRSIAEGDLSAEADADALAHFVQTVNFRPGPFRRPLVRLARNCCALLKSL